MKPDYVKITRYISAHRLQKYEQVCGGDRQKNYPSIFYYINRIQTGVRHCKRKYL